MGYRSASASSARAACLAAIPLIAVALSSTPAEIVATLNHEINAALDYPKVLSQLATLGDTPIPMTPDQFGALIASDIKKWGEVVRFAGIKAEWCGDTATQKFGSCRRIINIPTLLRSAIRSLKRPFAASAHGSSWHKADIRSLPIKTGLPLPYRVGEVPGATFVHDDSELRQNARMMLITDACWRMNK